MIDPQVQALCDEFEIKIVPKHLYLMPGQTRAVTECKGNHALIDKMALNAVSGLVLACSDMIEEDASTFLDLFDRIPFGPLMMMSHRVARNSPSGPCSCGHAIPHGAALNLVDGSGGAEGRPERGACQRGRQGPGSAIQTSPP